MSSIDTHDRGLGAALAGCAALAASVVLGTALAPFRDRFGLENVTILYLAIVAIAGAAGGRLGGFIAAISAALSYNFFFTTPYRTLAIDSVEQVITVLLLGGAGLVAGLAGDIGRRLAMRRASTQHRRDEALLDLLGLAIQTQHHEPALHQTVDGLHRVLGARWVALVPATAPQDLPFAAAGTPLAPHDRVDLPQLDPQRLIVGAYDGLILPSGFLLPAGSTRSLLVVPGTYSLSAYSTRVALAAVASILSTP